jgi:hypothetical protein
MFEWNRETIWRQGFLLDNAAIKSLNLTLPSHSNDTVVIIATHDCDLPQSPDIEPMFEVIVGNYVDELDGSSTNTKNPRKLHINIETKDGQKPAEFLAINKIFIPKEQLPKINQDQNTLLSVDNLIIFKRWLGIRYTRSAFPDLFDKRLKESGIDKKIANALRKHGEYISAIFFDVDGGNETSRYSPEDTYTLDISILYSTQHDPAAAEAAAELARVEINKLFKNKFYNQQNKSWVNIELRYLDVFSDEVFTYRQSVTYTQWRLDHISFSEDPVQEIVPIQ